MADQIVTLLNEATFGSRLSSSRRDTAFAALIPTGVFLSSSVSIASLAFFRTLFGNAWLAITWFKKPFACSILPSFSIRFFSLRWLAADGAGVAGGAAVGEAGVEGGCLSLDNSMLYASFPRDIVVSKALAHKSAG
jgi:hypothetical protein